MLNNKKAQVGETITWVIATIILIVILLVFIFASIALSKMKLLFVNVNLKDTSQSSIDWINSKTQMAFSINSDNKNKIVGWISQARNDGGGG